MKRVLLLGARGGIGSAISKALVQNYSVIELTRQDMDLAAADSAANLQKFLERIDPDLIVNAAGYFGNNQETHHPSMSVNFGTNWAIVQYYLDRCKTIDKPVKIVLIGSSTHRSGKKDYMLYSASKAAVFNLWQAARDHFQGSQVAIDIINPVKTRTRMAQGVPQPGWLEPEDVAEAVRMRLASTTSECIDMTYKD